MRYADHCEEMDDMEREAEANINRRNREIRELKARIAELEELVVWTVRNAYQVHDKALVSYRHRIGIKTNGTNAGILRALRQAKGE